MTESVEHLDTLCFGGEDWWYHNQGHIDMQLMRRFAQRGRLIYVNSLVMTKPVIREGSTFIKKVIRKSSSIFTGLKPTDAGFWAYSPFALPVHHVPWLRRFNGRLLRAQLTHAMRKLGMQDPLVWVACPVACDTALAMKPAKLVYQRTDRYEEYPNVAREVIEAYDRKLKAAADLTVYVSGELYRDERDACKKAVFLDHGVDFEFFSQAKDDSYQPPELANVPRPIVGFFGGFAEHTTDCSLIRDVVEQLPDLSFVFVGKANKESEVLLNLKNVWMLGQKPYREIPHYGKCFDVTIMPWKRNRWIQACNPIKLKEYLALGKPVISTPFAELAKYKDVVYEATDAASFAEAIRKALAEDSPERVAARQEKVADSSWDRRAGDVLAELFSITQCETAEVSYARDA